LGCLRRQDYADFFTVVVDNGSTDGSADHIQANFPEVRLVRLKENLGFAKATNIGIETALADQSVCFVAILNNDTRPASTWLSALHEAVSRDETVGFATSKLLFPDGRLQNAGLCLYRDLRGLKLGGISIGYGEDPSWHDRDVEVFGACGAAAIYRRRMLEQVGLFDEDLYAYGEDMDISLRARLAGWRCVYASRAEVIHFHSQTLGVRSKAKAFYVERNRAVQAFKVMPLRDLFVFVPLAAFNNIRLLASGKRGPTPEQPDGGGLGVFTAFKVALRAYCSFIGLLGKTIKKRRQLNKEGWAGLRPWFNTITREIPWEPSDGEDALVAQPADRPQLEH
jgi:GT2 family glycosyltransferase